MFFRVFILAAETAKRAVATALLPNASAFLYGGPYRRVNFRRGVLLHTREDVAVKVERDPNSRMAQAFLGDLWVNPVCEHVGRVRVPEIMEPDAG